jgi:hypothetical protein
MGKFNFRNKKTGKVVELTMTIAEAEQHEKDHPNQEWLCSSPSIGDPYRLGLKKPDDGFRDRLKDIKKSHHRSKINTW